MEFSSDEKVQYSKYILHALLPFLKRFYNDQMEEKKIEAKIQGTFFNSRVRRASEFMNDENSFHILYIGLIAITLDGHDRSWKCIRILHCSKLRKFHL